MPSSNRFKKGSTGLAWSLIGACAWFTLFFLAALAAGCGRIPQFAPSAHVNLMRDACSSCHGDVCPRNPRRPYRRAIGSEDFNDPLFPAIEDAAATEVKEECWRCPKAVPIDRSVVVVPSECGPGNSVQPSHVCLTTATRVVDPLNERKTGQWCCPGCSRVTLGADMHTTWLPNGQPLTFLCGDCWSRKSMTERMRIFESWASRQRTDVPTLGLMRQSLDHDER